jgi:hypothetical protein
MKIDYNILWLDDKAKTIKDDNYIEEIEYHLKELYFNPKIILTKNEEEFFENLNDEYDLILTDYHLEDGNNRNGDVIVREVREKSIFTEIMFYSAKGDVIDTNKLDRITFVDTSRNKSGHYDTVIENAKHLINLTVKKFENIVLMRGMIMNETSILDDKMLKIINKSLQIEGLFDEYFTNTIYEKALKLFEKKLEITKDCKSKSNFKQLTRDNFIFSSDFKIDSLKKIVEYLSLDDFTEEYKEKINTIRNKFAHAVLEEDGKGRKYFKYKEEGLTFDENLCKQIRKDLIGQKKNLNKVDDKL